MPLLINNEVAGEILSMKDCVEALESAFREEGDGSAANRTKSNIHIPTKQEEKWLAKERRLGQELPREWFLQDIRD